MKQSPNNAHIDFTNVEPQTIQLTGPYKEFVAQTTLDLSALIKKWKKSGALEHLLEIDKK